MALPVAVVLSGCSSTLTSPATEACSNHSSWVSEGYPIDRRDRIGRVISVAFGSDVPEAAQDAAADLTDALGTGEDGEIRAASTAFAESCRSNGWEPPEG